MSALCSADGNVLANAVGEVNAAPSFASGDEAGAEILPAEGGPETASVIAWIYQVSSRSRYASIFVIARP